MKKGIILLFGFLLVNTILGLMSSCDDCNPSPSAYQLNSIQSFYKKIIGKELNPNNELEFVLSEDTIPSIGIRFDSLGIEISPEYLSSSVIPNSSWNTSAYACEPAMNFSSLDSLIVISNSDYNANYPAGSDLSSIVKFRAGYFVNTYPIREFVNQNYFINFIQAPDHNSTHQLTIHLKLLDGRELNSSLPTILIKK